MDDLQFDKAEFATTDAVRCGLCQAPLSGSYYTVNGGFCCAACRERLDQALEQGSASSRFMRALLFGAGAAVAGGVFWWGVRTATGYEIGLIAIMVGLGVGRAVRAGSYGRGGRRYQVLAVALTYLGVAANYVPDVVSAFQKQKAEDAADQAAPPSSTGDVLFAFAMVFAIAAAAPFLGGASNLIGLLIIGFALWEAWRSNTLRVIEVLGPFELKGSPGG